MLGRGDTFKRSLRYGSRIFIGCLICWYGLRWAGIEDPVWAVITVVIVSDPDLATAVGLAKVRTINTVVGCLVGIGVLFVFGYSPLAAFVAAALTVVAVMMIERYPSNWRLAPATVIIVADAARLAETHLQEVQYSLLRMGEIVAGCAVALGLAAAYAGWWSHDRNAGGPIDHAVD